MTDSIKVIAICGSLREGSTTLMALKVALRGAADAGAETQLIDLRDFELAFCAGDSDEADEGYPPDVFRLREEVRNAQGIILGTPEYHGGLSGVLKNALDLMDFEEFGGKMVGLVGVSGGSMGAVNALNSLRTIGRALHAWVVPEQMSIPEAYNAFDDAGNLRKPRMEQRLLAVGRQVARFAFLHSSGQIADFLRQWETAPENPGAEN